MFAWDFFMLRSVPDIEIKTTLTIVKEEYSTMIKRSYKPIITTNFIVHTSYFFGLHPINETLKFWKLDYSLHQKEREREKIL